MQRLLFLSIINPMKSENEACRNKAENLSEKPDAVTPCYKICFGFCIKKLHYTVFTDYKGLDNIQNGTKGISISIGESYCSFRACPIWWFCQRGDHYSSPAIMPSVRNQNFLIRIFIWSYRYRFSPFKKTTPTSVSELFKKIYMQYKK